MTVLGVLAVAPTLAAVSTSAASHPKLVAPKGDVIARIVFDGSGSATMTSHEQLWRIDH
jgi:hypothetical protein